MLKLFLIARRAIQADGTDRQYLGVLAVTSNSAVNAPIENYHCDTFHLRAQDTQARILTSLICSGPEVFSFDVCWPTLLNH